MQWKSKGLHLLTHMINLKLVQSTMVPLKFRTKDCNMHWKVSKDQRAWKILKVVTDWNKQRESPVLRYWILRPVGGLLREKIARACHLALQRWTKKFRRVPQFLVLIMVQTKYWLQPSEFLPTKDREIAANVHQGSLSVDFDDEWICA